MESDPLQPSRDDAGARLAEATRARQRLAASLRLPAGLYPVLAIAVAVQVSTAAYGIAEQTAAGLAVVLGGAAAFYGMAALALRQFRRLNGVRVGGLVSQLVLGSRGASSAAYLGAFGAATWAAFQSQWWLVAAAAVAGGCGYAFSVDRWWRAYQHDPAAHAAGATPRLLAALAGLACLGLVALVLAS